MPPLWLAVVIALVFGTALGFGWGVIWPRKDEQERKRLAWLEGYRQGKRWRKEPESEQPTAGRT